ncbi:hypothetical protein Vi05172_g10911 [Venturia inaequalis]|nr:hypothetical protein Vi05172_g10911 [Venturia inaequalis]
MEFRGNDHTVGPHKLIFDLKNKIQALQIENADLRHDNEHLHGHNKSLHDELAKNREKNMGMRRAYELALAQHQGFRNWDV